jgi:hypothetical protein
VPVRANVAIHIKVVEQHELARQLVMVGTGIFLKKTQRRIAFALAEVTQHLIVGAILFDDIEHMLDGGGNTRGILVEHLIGIRGVRLHLGGVVGERFVGERGNEGGRPGLDVSNVLNARIRLPDRGIGPLGIRIAA